MRVFSWSILSLAVAAMAGCSQTSSSSQQAGGNKSARSSAKLLASASTLELMDALEDASPDVRRASQEALQRKVGTGVTFRPYAPPEKRAAAIATYRRLQDLADEHDEQYFIDLVPILLDRMASDDPPVRRHAWRDVAQLTGFAHPTHADDAPAERQEAIAYYRDLWAKWQHPKSRILEFKRHPEKLREHKRQWAEELRRRESAARQN